MKCTTVNAAPGIGAFHAPYKSYRAWPAIVQVGLVFQPLQIGQRVVDRPDRHPCDTTRVVQVAELFQIVNVL